MTLYPVAHSSHAARRLALPATSACDPVPPAAAARRPDSSYALWVLWLAVILAVGPFVVRRIILLGDDNYVHWMAIDYAARCISLTGVALGFRSGLLFRAHPRADWLTSLRVFVLLFAAENAERAFGFPIVQHYLRFVEISSWPHILDPNLRALDLSLGLLLVAVSEELVFRKFLFAVIERWFPGRYPAVIISAAAFALIHFTSGIVDTMANAFIHGIFLGIAYWTTRRLSICVASHYLIDLFLFSGH